MHRRTYTPEQYRLHVTPDLQGGTFGIQEEIILTVDAPTQEIRLHAVDIRIDSLTLACSDTPIVHTMSQTEDELVIVPGSPLSEGKYTIQLTAVGKLQDMLAGWYKSYFTRADGSKGMVITTQCESVDARRICVCIDEPLYKAVFAISMTIPHTLEGISNMPIQETVTHTDGTKTLMFAPTPRMSSYLLYLGVGEFEYHEEVYDGRVTIRGITTPDKSRYTRYATQLAKDVIAFFEEFFGIRYPLPKLDQIAIADYAMGAMENWGAIVYREERLLYYEGITSVASRMRMSDTIAHELAHQWFGNLVTMEWWDDLWLNESFATFMAYLALDHLYPEWKIWEEYLQMTVFDAMQADSRKSTHPIRMQLADTEGIDAMFDEITYDKGGSILWMIYTTIGREAFREGLRVYLSERSYANATMHDLIRHWEQASALPLSDMLSDWITTTGFPAVSVTTRQGGVVLSQERCMMLGEEKGRLWKIPLIIRYQDGTEERSIMDTETMELSSVPLLINAGYGSFFVTLSDAAHHAVIAEKIDRLSTIERLGYVHDIIIATLARRYTLSEMCQMLSVFDHESDPSVLSYALSQIHTIRMMTGTRADVVVCEKSFAERAFALTGTTPRSDEAVSMSALRMQTMLYLVKQDHPEVHAWVDRMYDRLEEEGAVHPDLRGIVYAGAAWKDSELHALLHDSYASKTIEEEKAKLLSALTYTKEAHRLDALLSYALSESVRFAHLPYLFRALPEQTHHRRMILNWILSSWDTLVERGGSMADGMLGRMLASVIPVVAVGQMEEARNFLSSFTRPGLKKGANELMEQLDIIEAFLQHNSL